MEHRKNLDRQYQAVVRNERLTALAGATLLVGFVVDLYVTADLRKLIMAHIFIGALLAGPLIVKLTSVGHRFVRYYGKSTAFVAKGTPNIWLRLMAPFWILVTLILFLSGLVLALEGSPDNRLVFLTHALSAAVWIPLLAVHVYAHIRQVPRAISADWGAAYPQSLLGRRKRLRIMILALIGGAIAGLVLTRIAAPWRHVILPAGLGGPLMLGLGAAVIGVLIAIPVLRGARD